jgi:iron complex transport system substrate-binding protein
MRRKSIYFLTTVVLALIFAAVPCFPRGEGETSVSEESTDSTKQKDQSYETGKSYTNPVIIGETENTVTILDSFQQEIVLTKRPQRVIVQYTSMLGVWYMAGGKVVGRPATRSERGVPAAAMEVETTGHVANPNVEKMLSLAPDLVVLSGSMEVHGRIKEVFDQNGIENISLDYENYDDFVRILDLFVRLNGKEELTNNPVPVMQDEVNRIVGMHNNGRGPTFLSLFASSRDVSVELNGSHTAYIASMLGGRNIAEGAASRLNRTRVTLSLERIVEAQPEVILVTVMGELSQIKERMSQEFESSPAWNGLEAVRTGSVHYLPYDLFLYKPNERFPEAFQFIADLLYPEAE